MRRSRRLRTRAAAPGLLAYTFVTEQFNAVLKGDSFRHCTVQLFVRDYAVVFPWLWLCAQAIDLLDEAASGLKMAQESKPDAIQAIEQQIRSKSIEAEVCAWIY